MWTVDSTLVTTDSTVYTVDGFGGVSTGALGVPGPGISPDIRTVFTHRRLSAEVPSGARAGVALGDGFAYGGLIGLPPTIGVIRAFGPGISPDYNRTFDARKLSSQLPATLLGGIATGQGFARGSLTGVGAPIFIGLRREPGPGISPAVELVYTTRALSTALPVVLALRGAALGSGYSVGTLSASAALMGAALGQGYGAAGTLFASGALTGAALGTAVTFGFLGTGSLTNITGIAFASGAAYAPITGRGALLGVASGQGVATGALDGAIALRGLAIGQGYTVGSLFGSGAAMSGSASWQCHAYGRLAGLAPLQGLASSEGQAAGSLLGTANLTGAALATGYGSAAMVGAGSLSGLSFGQGYSFAAIQGAAPIQGVTLGQSSAYGLLLDLNAGRIQGVSVSASFSYGALAGIGHAYGWAVVNALSQTGLPVARACYIEESACRVTAAYFDTSGVPFVPNAVRYRIDDVLSGSTILDWTSIGPALSNTIVVTSAQNAMVSLSRTSESHQVLFEITDGFGNVSYADVSYDVIRVAGLA